MELLQRASSELPIDVREAIVRGLSIEQTGTAASRALQTILDNVDLSQQQGTPLCQDTGANIWHVHHPQAVSTPALTRDIRAATAEACRRSILRRNAVDAVTGRNSGNNLGVDFPFITFSQWKQKSIAASVMLKGGGCENVSAQYALPDERLHAGRDLEGVRRVVLDAVYSAGGRGCAPGILGVGIGGDRVTGMMTAKNQLFRLLTDTNPVASLAALEERILTEANDLGIGPMGFGGRTTLLGVKIGALHRVPASMFVSISYMCWACRRCSVIIHPDGRTVFGNRAIPPARGHRS